ncbi:low temperature viability 1 family protein [Amylibacter sp.]|nr:low temperature viability 1 family protein [Amylibacter sp.]
MKKASKDIPDSIFGFQLIEEILQALEDEGIDYWVLRNSDGILGKFPSGDVDVLVNG